MSAQDKVYSREYATPGLFHRDFWNQPNESGLRPMKRERERAALEPQKHAGRGKRG